jgi:2-polyprenyl-3-methyl-5-hydroxy-6-metoxy-1,4-benzoquinol methylase
MSTTREEQFWDNWNEQRVVAGLVGVRLALCEAAVAELRRLCLAPGLSLMDVGCGAGWTGEWLHRGFDYLGLDLSPQAIESAKARVPGARFEAADFHEWPEPAGHYDVVLSVDAIAYFRDQDAVVAKMARALKPRGWLVMTTLNPYVYARMSHIDPPGQGQVRKWLTRRALHALLERNGFEVLRSRSILPTGDRGLLRWTNAPKLNRPLNALLGKQQVKRLKEVVGLGQFRVVTARRL